jgi:hypothetical protein
MELATSDIIAIGSAVISTLTLIHTVQSAKANSLQIEELARRYERHTGLIATHQASQKYVALLSDVSLRFEEILAKLAYPASEAQRAIGEVFDSFDSKPGEHPYLRHAFQDLVDRVRKAYDFELTYQTGLNLADRIRQLKFIRSEFDQYMEARADTPPKKSFFDLFFKRQSQPASPEDYIRRSAEFWQSLNSIYERIPREREPEVFSKALECIAEYRRLHEASRDELQELELRLENGLKENSLELIKIENTPILGDKYTRTKGDIARALAFYFPDFYHIESIQVEDGIAYSLYAGSILRIMADHHTWGRLGGRRLYMR